MLHRMIAGVLTCGLVFGFGVNAAVGLEDKPEPKKDKQAKAAMPICPVMGDEPVDFTMSAATDDGPVFFCCAGCIEKYTAKPEKYADKVAEQRKALADLPKVQVSCPLSGKPVNQEISIDHNGSKVYFCEQGCADKFKENPAQYAGKLAGSYTYQTVCPLMKKPIDPSKFVDLATGQRIYVCCGKCKGRLAQDPLKLKDKLAEQGIHLDEEKLKK